MHDGLNELSKNYLEKINHYQTKAKGIIRLYYLLGIASPFHSRHSPTAEWRGNAISWE